VALSFQPSFDDLSAPLIDVTFCVLDLETTGGSAADCEITEIGAVKHRGGELLGTFQTLVDPGGPIPPFITVLTGITETMVAKAPTIVEVLPSFLEFMGDSVIVGHNVRFDLSFLRAAVEQCGYPPLENRWVDTAALARRLVRDEVRNLKLGTLAAHFRSPVQPVHRALGDAQATAHVFHTLLERAGTLGVTNLDDLLQLPTARGATHYSKIRLTEDLPRRPGVYIFRDRHGDPIYIGKSTNLRGRVRQYFYGDQRRSVSNLMRELHSVDHIVCESAIEAEVVELRLIHAHRPRYNRRSRPPKSSHFIKVTDETFPRLSVVRIPRPDGLALLGPFRSRRSAQEVVMALWDAVPLRRCRKAHRGGGPCAAAQIGVARCPCDGSLSAAEYRSVVDTLLEGMTSSPPLLLGPLTERMHRLARERRYEEAAGLRDRHNLLARALETRRIWETLLAAGYLVAEDERGNSLVIDHGRLVGTRAEGTALVPSPTTDTTSKEMEVPPSVEAAEEARLLWKWLDQDAVRLLELQGTLTVPRDPIVQLRPGGSKAA
jgi:DNA polymerase-3 subunit epsilon